MDYNRDKVDDATLALIYLVTWQEDRLGARAWKGFEWDTLGRLFEKGYIGNPVGKAKSVVVTPEGLSRSKALFEQYFAE
jgi:hypothetical protein